MAGAIWEDDEEDRHGEICRGGRLVVAHPLPPPRAGLHRRRLRAREAVGARQSNAGVRGGRPPRREAVGEGGAPGGREEAAAGMKERKGIFMCM